MTIDTPPMLTDDPLHIDVPVFRADAHRVAPGVLMHSQFVNTYAVETSDGLFLVDPGLAQLAPRVHETLRALTGARLHTAMYTHGHVDHACGLRPWLDAGERPNIVAQEHAVARFRRYELTWGYNAIINQRQFSLPEPSFPNVFVEPTVLVRDALTQRIGDTEVRYHAAKGETDDALYAWLPDRGLLFTGDLIVWSVPNCGNPQKVQRYPVEWAEALETMAALDAEYLFPGHGLAVRGRDAVRTVLTETAAYLRHLIDQTLALLNEGRPADEIVDAVEPHPELSTRPFLRVVYDHPKFIVRNLVRLYGGWWNGVASELLPASRARRGAEIAALAGGIDALVRRGRDLLARDDLELAAHVADWAVHASPDHAPAQELKRDVYRARRDAAGETMTRGVYHAAMNDAVRALGGEPEPPPRVRAM